MFDSRNPATYPDRVSPAAPTSDRRDPPIGVVRGLARCPDDLVRLFRARKDELMLSDLTVDEIAGNQSGYTGKLLGQACTKGVSMAMLFTLSGALGLAVAVVEDSEALRRYVDRAPRKVRRQGELHMLKRLSKEQRVRVLEAVSWRLLKRETLSEIGRKGGEQSSLVRRDKIPRRRRCEIGRIAARARWG